MLIVLKTLILSIIQAFTEFLPISSTAHLLIAGWMMDFNINDGKLFDTIIQLATSLAVFWLYKDKFLHLLTSFFYDKDSRRLCYKICIATIPSVFVGLVFYNVIKNYLYSINVIAISLILGGILFLIVEKNKKNQQNGEQFSEITYKKSFLIGLFQSIAVIPGASRSGMTIIGGLLNKLSRKDAVEFSFFLAVPVMFLASIFDLYKNYNNLNSSNIPVIIIGFISTFLFTIPIIKWFIKFISANSFKVFAYYRILFGIVILMWQFYVKFI